MTQNICTQRHSIRFQRLKTIFLDQQTTNKAFLENPSDFVIKSFIYSGHFFKFLKCQMICFWLWSSGNFDLIIKEEVSSEEVSSSEESSPGISRLGPRTVQLNEKSLHMRFSLHPCHWLFSLYQK